MADLTPISLPEDSPQGSRPIFITGAPRSGTSWLGQILGSYSGMRYVYEPFNHQWNPKLSGQLQQFKYLSGGAKASLEINRNGDRAFEGRQNIKQIGRALYRGYWMHTLGPFDRVVVKDPTAVLMADWIQHRYAADIVFITRHPCGFASSIMAQGWKISLKRLFNQKPLMDEYLGEFSDLLERAEQDPWLRLGAFWGAVHFVAFKQLNRYAHWHLCIYEDLCNDPIRQVLAVTERLGLGSLNNSTLKLLNSRRNQNEGDSGSTRKDSKKMPEIWKERLSPHQIDAVIGVVAEFGLGSYELLGR